MVVKISIVTISYNQAEYLERAIQSVVEQCHEEVEYIVADPGSTDGSRDIIERYRSRINEVVYERDAGPADGLNKGFARATGDIYGFLNSDDILLPDTLKQVAAYFAGHPEVDVVSGHAVIIDENDKAIRNSYSDRCSLTRYAYGASVLMQPSTFFRADTFRKAGGFNAENKTNWDGELFVDMRLQGARFARINRFLSGYRLQPESITSSAKLDQGIKEYHQRMFRKIMGRNEMYWDVLPRAIFRLLKYTENPRALIERVRKGPVYGRGASESG